MGMIQKDLDFLDKVAIETMKVYLSKKPPTGFDDSMTIARISYKNALAMLDVRKNQLEDLIPKKTKE